MPYRISGNISEDSRIIVIDESDWSIESNTERTAGYYSIENLEMGNKLTIAKTSSGDTVAYGNVAAVANEPPEASVITLVGLDEDTTGIITNEQLLADVIDPEGQPLTVSGVSADSGNLVDNEDGTWDFTPDPEYNGLVTFTYDISDGINTVENTASLSILYVNDAPYSSLVTLTAIDENSSNNLITEAQLLVNAGDVEDDSLSVNGVAINTGNGTLVDSGGGNWRYTPLSGDESYVQFTYNITDGTDTVVGTANMDILKVLEEIEMIKNSSNRCYTIYPSTFYNNNCIFGVNGTCNAFIRFAGIMIPRGATIVEAKLHLRLNSTNTTYRAVQISMENATNPLAPYSYADFITKSNNTISAGGSISIGGSAGTWDTSYHMTAVQTMINNGGWNPGQSMQFYLPGNNLPSTYAYNTCELIIKYMG